MARARFVVALVACIALFLPVAAPLAVAHPEAATSASSGLRSMSVEELREKGPEGLRALAWGEEDPEQSISGTVTLVGGYPEDADFWVMAWADDPDFGDWFPVDFSDVASDGTYCLPLYEPGTYRVGIWDFNGVYEDLFWPDVSWVESATDIAVGSGEHVTGIDLTVHALPELTIAGRVGFTSAPPPRGAVDVVALVWDDYFEEWWPAAFAPMKADQSYRLHLPEPGEYRVGFFDYSGGYEEVYYLDAATPEDATVVTLGSAPASVTAIDQTMTMAPSARYAGQDRYGTAVALSEATFDSGSAGTVILASGERWPDALCAGPYAAATRSPLLLTRRSAIPFEVLAEIERLDPMEVVIVGGYGAVGLDAEIELRTYLGIPFVRRIVGRDRYETAAFVADEMAWMTWGSDVPTVTLVSGERFADALAAGPVAGWNAWPMLLTRQGELPEATMRFFDRHDVGSVLAVGGTRTISDDVLSELPPSVRVAGADRYDTAARLADWGEENAYMSGHIVGLASGERFPDGVCAGAYLGMWGRPMLLTRCDDLPSPTGALLDRRSGTIARMEALGGQRSVSDRVFEEALSRAGL